MPYRGEIVNNYFDNLLPDNDLIRKRIQARFSVASDRCFDLLSCIGADCIGALQLLTQPKVTSIKKIQAKPISHKEIAQLLKQYQTAPLGMARELDFRISIAGAQEKTALLWHQNQWCIPQGTTPTSHIIKLPIGQIKHSHIDLTDSVENEWLCLKILSAYRLPVCEAKIESFADVKTLVVTRFDRRLATDGNWLMRLPQEDFCQALGGSSALKYQSDGGPGITDIMQTLLGAEDAAQDREQFMKSVFLFWVMGAIDGHAKNFSIYLQPGGRYQLTPLYDVISAYPLVAKNQLQCQKLKMAMLLKSANNHYLWQNIKIRHWLVMAKHCQFSEEIMQNIIDEIFDEMEDVIHQVASSLPKNFPAQMSEAIFSGMRKIKNQKM